MSWDVSAKPISCPVSCGKQSFGHHDVKQDAYKNGAHGDKQHQKLMTQNPSQAAIVDAQKQRKQRLELTRKPALFFPVGS